MAAPIFKKRNRTSRTIVKPSLLPPTEPKQDDQDDTDSTAVQDLLALRALTRKPVGIQLEKLNKGEEKKKKKKSKAKKGKTADEKWEQQMAKGGIMSKDDDDEEEKEDEAAPQAKRLVRTDNFQGETGTVDVDKHMMAYIESEMRKRRSNHESLPTDSSLAAAVNDPEDQLYRVAEKYRALQRAARPAPKSQEEDEGNVTLSAAMLSSIPEIDLGIDTRMKNIQETEKAKRAFYEKRNEKDESIVDQEFPNTRFFRPQHRNHSDLDALRREMRDQDEVEEGVTTTAIDTGIGSKTQTASDQQVLDRFKKRQRNALK